MDTRLREKDLSRWSCSARNGLDDSRRVMGEKSSALLDFGLGGMSAWIAICRVDGNDDDEELLLPGLLVESEGAVACNLVPTSKLNLDCGRTNASLLN